MKNKDLNAFAELMYKELLKIGSADAVVQEQRLQRLSRLFCYFFGEASKFEHLYSATLFSQISVVATRFHFDKRHEYFLHRFRKLGIENHPKENETKNLFQLGIKGLATAISIITQSDIPKTLQKHYPEQWPDYQLPSLRGKYQKSLKVLLLEDREADNYFIGKCIDEPFDIIKITYGQIGVNDNFDTSIKLIKKVFQFPVLVNLLDVTQIDDGSYSPRALVIEPDYLMDISAIAASFQHSGADPWQFLLKKYLPFSVSPALMLGNIANYFLDELMSNPEVSFRELIKGVFELAPLEFCLFSDQKVKEIIQKSQKHFINLKSMVQGEFGKVGINTEASYLEPSFIAPLYGIQGRLDLFYHAPEEKKSVVVELKSGRAFRPNAYGISASHYMQTLLYDLLISTVFSLDYAPASYILYSGQDTDCLRYAPITKALQYEGINIRNQLLGLEEMLCRLGKDNTPVVEQGDRLFRRLRLASFPTLKGFSRDNIALFEESYKKMDDLRKKYFILFSGFIAREHRLSKTGVQGIDRMNGFAAIWMDDFDHKIENFTILNHLIITKNNAIEKEPVIHLKKSPQTTSLANFRKGDIAVFYPVDKEGSATGNQLFKCTIIHLGEEEIRIRLRSKQFNKKLFQSFEYWSLEHDLLDSGFTGMYRSLFEMINHPSQKTDLLLGVKAPEKPSIDHPIPHSHTLTDEQSEIFQKIVHAKDYFLLWGPPGTGKTSIMLRELVRHLFENKSGNILLLAYTNRAVDEICAAIESIHPDMHRAYIRIGSKYATHPDYTDRLLSVLSSEVSTRRELQDLVEEHRIFVATVASLSGKRALLKLKKFDIAIIDEASQIPEPMLVGLLPHFGKFVLIGDHLQLPAVVTQDSRQSVVNDKELQQLGLTNLRNALFERLFLLAKKNGWEHCFSQLSKQGRMHRDIMQFANRYFYQNTLEILPDDIPHSIRQKQPLPLKTRKSGQLAQQLLSKRLHFFDVPRDESTGQLKTNRFEAEKIVEIIRAYIEIFEENKLELTNATIGIITPYRAQIALLQHHLKALGDIAKKITVDTVERYQGSARDIIIISTCVNSELQFQSLVSLSETGVDRKLNVALTRAKEQLIVVGNREVLSTNEIYRALVLDL